MKRFMLFSFLYVSCGTETGNPVVSVQFLLDESQAPAPVTIAEAFVSAKQIELRNAADCNGSAEIEVEGPFALDLLSQASPAQLQNLTVKGGAYCRFEFEWNAAPDPLPGAPAALTGKSLIISGFLPDDTPFIVRSERNGAVRLDNDAEGFPIDQTTNNLFVAFRAEALFAGIDFESALPDVDGVIRIETGQNEALLDLFEENLEEALRLFDDDNGNDTLDVDEGDDADVLAIPSAF